MRVNARDVHHFAWRWCRENRSGVGGAALQAVRQFGGTFGVALTIAFLGAPRGLDDALARFERVWWLIVAGGLATSILSLPMRRIPSRPAR